MCRAKIYKISARWSSVPDPFASGPLHSRRSPQTLILDFCLYALLVQLDFKQFTISKQEIKSISVG